MTSGVVYTDIPRVDREIVDLFKEWGVATVHEAMGKTGLMMPTICALGAKQHACGQAITAAMVPGDNLAVHVALHYARVGDVVVAACGGGELYGVFGELLATSALARSVSGFITDGGIRDARLIEDLGFAAWAKAKCARGTVKHDLLGVNIPVGVAGVVVWPGDIVVADEDGVAVVPWRDAEMIAERAGERESREERTRAEYARGTSSYEHHRLDELLDKASIRVIDGSASSEIEVHPHGID